MFAASAPNLGSEFGSHGRWRRPDHADRGRYAHLVGFAFHAHYGDHPLSETSRALRLGWVETVIWMVMREALALLGIGLAVGVPCAYLLSQYVGSQLFGVKANDVWTAALSLVILGVVAAGAGFLPARRASAIDPIKALRYE